MKKNLHLIIALLVVQCFSIVMNTNAQVAINTTGAAPDASAMLDVSSTSKGLLAPRMTLAQRSLIGSPATGLLVYQTDGLTGFYFYDGTSWTILSNTGYWAANGASIYNTNADRRVGIGTGLPLARLHVQDSSVLFNGPQNLPSSPGLPPISGAGNRMMWYADKAAIRAGGIFMDGWDANNVGYYSAAFGQNVVASGDGSFAFGQDSRALSDYSFAGGQQCVSSASGAIALGYGNVSNGLGSITIGVSNNSSRVGSISIGSGDTSLGNGSYAMGLSSKSIGDHSFSLGFFTKSKAERSFSIGAFNDTLDNPTDDTYDNDRIFQIGIGEFYDRKNAVTILRNGNMGLGNINSPTEQLELTGAIKIGDASSATAADGTIRYTRAGFEGHDAGSWVPLMGSTSFWSANSTSIFNNNTDRKVGIGTNTPLARLHVADSSVLFSAGTTLPTSPGLPPISGAGNRMMWYADKAAFRVGGAINNEWDIDNTGNYSFAAGLGNKVASNYSSALGSSNTVYGFSSIAIGSSNTANGETTTSIGHLNTASGDYSTAIGTNNNAIGEFSSVTGYFNKVKSFGGIVTGLYNDTSDAPNSMIPNSSDRLFQIGNGSADNIRSNAITVLRNANTSIGNILNPTEKLEVEGAIKIGNTSSVSAADGTIRYTTTGFEGRHGGAWIPFTGSGSGGSSSTSLWAANGTHIYNTNTNNVGIGTNTPTAKLQVTNGSVVFNGPAPIPDVSTETPPVSGAGSRMMWYANKAAFRAGMVYGTEWDNSNLGKYSTAFGYGTQATNTASFALGINSTASGQGAFAGGSDAVANNDKTFAYGSSVTASGAGSIAMGLGTTASGNYSTAMGLGALAQGQSSFCLGVGTKSKALNSFVIGEYNEATDLPAALTPAGTDRLFQLGNGTSSSNHNAITVLRNGFVGIGYTSQSIPSDLLEVNGKIGCVSVTTLSDRRYKTNIKTIDNGLDKILKLRGVTYDWDKTKTDKNLDSKNHIGFIAQELEQVLPQAVNVADDAQKTRTVDYQEVIPVLVEAIKDQQKEIDTLKKALNEKDAAFAQRIAALEAIVLNNANKTDKK